METAPERTIILVYEHESIRRKIARTLMTEGYRVLAYASVDAFLDSMPVAGSTCIVLGVPSAEFDGPDLVDQLLFLGADNALVAITVDAELAASLRVSSRGRFTVIQIPIEENILITAVRRAFSETNIAHPSRNNRPVQSLHRLTDD